MSTFETTYSANGNENENIHRGQQWKRLDNDFDCSSSVGSLLSRSSESEGEDDNDGLDHDPVLRMMKLDQDQSMKRRGANRIQNHNPEFDLGEGAGQQPTNEESKMKKKRDPNRFLRDLDARVALPDYISSPMGQAAASSISLPQPVSSASSVASSIESASGASALPNNPNNDIRTTSKTTMTKRTAPIERSVGNKSTAPSLFAKLSSLSNNQDQDHHQQQQQQPQQNPDNILQSFTNSSNKMEWFRNVASPKFQQSVSSILPTNLQQKIQYSHLPIIAASSSSAKDDSSYNKQDVEMGTGMLARKKQQGIYDNCCEDEQVKVVSMDALELGDAENAELERIRKQMNGGGAGSCNFVAVLLDYIAIIFQKKNRYTLFGVLTFFFGLVAYFCIQLLIRSD